MKLKRIDTYSLVLTGVFCSLLIISTFIRIPTPLIPLTFQFLFANLTGLLLGKKYAPLCILLYIAFLLITSGVTYAVSPSFGFVIGFLPGAFAAALIGHKKTDVRHLAIASAVNLFIVYLFGTLYFWLFGKLYLGATQSVKTIFTVCVLIPLLPDIVKCVLSIIAVKALAPFLNKEK